MQCRQWVGLEGKHQRLSPRSVWGSGGCRVLGSVSGILGVGLMSWESGGVGECCALGPDHPRSSGMGGLSPSSESIDVQVLRVGGMKGRNSSEESS